MPVVTNTIKRPDGTAYTSGRVVIELAGENGRPLSGGYVSASDYTLESAFTIETLTLGVWSQSLVANTLISPSGTAWRITEQVDGRSHVYYVTVPNGAGPYFVEDILTDAPAGIASAPLSAHAAAADPHTGYVLESLVDAKGDLLVGSAADTVARLAVGANDYVLTADSAQATGLKWAAASAGASLPASATQSGSTAAGTPFKFLEVTPASAATPKFIMELGGASFGGVEDPVVYMGFNVRSGGNRYDTGKASVGFCWEGDYLDGAVRTQEIYAEVRDQTGTYSCRPWFFQARQDPGSQNAQLRQAYILGNPLLVKLPDGTQTASIGAAATNFQGATDFDLQVDATSGTPSLSLKKAGTTVFSISAGISYQSSINVEGREIVRFTSATDGRRLNMGAVDLDGIIAHQFRTDTWTGFAGFLSKSRATPGANQDHFRMTDSADAILTRFNKDAYFMTRKNTAPADGDLVANEMAVWFDPTNGAAKLMVKAKQADGTVRTGELALA